MLRLCRLLEGIQAALSVRTAKRAFTRVASHHSVKRAERKVFFVKPSEEKIVRRS